MGGDFTMKVLNIFFLMIALLALGQGSLFAGTPQQQMAEMAAMANANGVVQGKDGWLFLREELEHMASKGYSGVDVLSASKASKPEFADPLPAIVDFNKQLKEKGIELIFMPIPPKALIYSDYLPVAMDLDAVAELEESYQKFYKQLRQQGVQVLDLIPDYRAASKAKQLYCKTDTHFSGLGLAMAADELATIIKKKSWYDGGASNAYTKERRIVAILGDLSQMQKTEKTEEIPLQFVTDSKTTKAPLVNGQSPVLLLGDSHTLVFSVGGDLHTSGAGLFDQLSADLGQTIDRIGVRGSGATASRIKLYQRSRKDTSFLKQKKIVIWCLSARELTGSGGWKKIPVAKKK